MRTWPLIALLLVGSHDAAASGERWIGPIGVELENGQDPAQCVDDVSGLCLASMRGDSFGNATVDLTQHIHRARVTVDQGAVRELLPLMLLPGGEVVFDARDIQFDQDVLPFLTQNVGERRAPAPMDDYAIEMNETGIWYHRRSLDPADPLAPPEPKHTALVYYEDNGPGHWEMPGAGEGGILIGAEPHRSVWLVCVTFENEECHAWNEENLAHTAQWTPNISVGGGLSEVGAQTLDGAKSAASFARATPSDPFLGVTPATYPIRPLDVSVSSAVLMYEPSSSARSAPAPRAVTPLQAQASARVIGARDPTDGPSPPEALLPLAASFVIALTVSALYARIRSRQEALALATRQQLIVALTQAGPLTVSDLARRLSVDRSTALYHIRILKRSASVKIVHVGRLVYVFLPGQTPPALPTSFRDGAVDIVLSVLRAAGGAVSRADLHILASDVPLRRRNEVLRHLTEKGVVERAFVGNAEVVRLAARPLQASTPAPVVFK